MSPEISYCADRWLILVASLPTANATQRMRVWRSLKSQGCAVLRDGVYLLPAREGFRQALRMHAEDIKQGGGSAYLLEVANPPDEEPTNFKLLFDRSEEYRALMARMAKFQAKFAAFDASAVRRHLKQLRRDLEALMALDYFPGAGKAEAETVLAQAESAFFASLAQGEPRTGTGSVVARDKADYQGRVWSTRKHLWVDRLASAWLVRRFVDRDARFLWLEKPEDGPADALGFDFDGAEFTHVGKMVTFEVLLASFGLETDPALAKLGGLIHCLDVGGVPVAEAAGVEMVLNGARQRCADDDALLADASAVFDSLYAAFAE